MGLYLLERFGLQHESICVGHRLEKEANFVVALFLI
jgi:hypothetical protein